MRREDGRTEPESCRQLRAAAWIGKDIVEWVEIRWALASERKSRSNMAWSEKGRKTALASTAIASENEDAGVSGKI
jgi:hypothetical protein